MSNTRYRAWDENSKEMVYFDLFSINNVEYFGHDLKKMHIMECLGIKDPKGVDIYEGDIIKDKRYIEVIMWDDLLLKFIRRNQFGWNRQIKEKMGEVLGNVYMNPELLTN